MKANRGRLSRSTLQSIEDGTPRERDHAIIRSLEKALEVDGGTIRQVAEGKTTVPTEPGEATTEEGGVNELLRQIGELRRISQSQRKRDANLTQTVDSLERQIESLEQRVSDLEQKRGG